MCKLERLNREYEIRDCWAIIVRLLLIEYINHSIHTD